MKKRFINKIFVNKRGPLFYSNKKDEERKLRNSEFEGRTRRNITWENLTKDLGVEKADMNTIVLNLARKIRRKGNNK